MGGEPDERPARRRDAFPAATAAFAEEAGNRSGLQQAERWGDRRGCRRRFTKPAVPATFSNGSGRRPARRGRAEQDHARRPACFGAGQEASTIMRRVRARDRQKDCGMPQDATGFARTANATRRPAPGARSSTRVRFRRPPGRFSARRRFFPPGLSLVRRAARFPSRLNL